MSPAEAEEYGIIDQIITSKTDVTESEAKK